MNRYRCQICGRRKGLRKDGGIAHHYVAGVPCRGIGHPGIETDDAALEQEAKRLATIAREQRQIIRDLVNRRVNYIDPCHARIADDAQDKAWKLERRLKRWRDGPARYHRQMAKYGWAQVPPDYLLKRYAGETQC